jgi:hypothetical protein
LLKKRLFAAQDIFSDNASVRSAEKSQIFRGLRSPRVIGGKNMIPAQSHCPSFSATCQCRVSEIRSIISDCFQEPEGSPLGLPK